MNDLDRWQQGNDDYLAAALAWLRLRLQRLGSPAPTPVVTPVPLSAPIQAEVRWRFRRHAPPVVDTPTMMLPPPADVLIEEQLAQAAAAMSAAEAIEPPPALVILSQRFGLSRFEQEVLLLCAALELDTRIATLCARAQDEINRQYPTFALALTLFDDPAWDALAPGRPLRYWRLIEINQPGAQSLTTSTLRADERIVNYLKGLNYLDDRLAPLLSPLEVGESQAALPPSQQGLVESIVRHLQQTAGTPHLPVIQLAGPDAPSKQLVAQHAAAALGLSLYCLPAEVVPSQAAELETLARLWQRESHLLPIALYLNAHEVERSTEGPASSLNRFLSRSRGLLFLDTRDVWSGVGRSNLIIDVAKPTPIEQREAWTAALGPNAANIPAQLAGQFNLSVATIQAITQTVLADTPVDDPPTVLRDRLWEACVLHTRPRLDALAQRLDPKATWDDIVLPEPEFKLLRQVAAQMGQRSKVYDEWGFRHKMNRGLGISVLFAGDSGTGKTMAAEVLANDLCLNLYRIDLSAVMSKYIGETEKNLRRLFNAAEDGGTILFFDEADSLFGKRSEVKDSHDRYANIEINYLLQRMEVHRGLAILATNMKSALDTAFMRRLRFIVNFSFPGTPERKRIWERAFPEETEKEALDYERLAKFNLTGGSIQNIAINAAFLAARVESPVTMPLIFEAVRTEFRKLEKPTNEAEFRLIQVVETKA
jgi:hypothetical protein